MKLRDKLNLMRKIDETNRVNVERWKRVMAGSITGFVIDPVAGSTEAVQFCAEDLPELFGLDKRDDIQQVDILLENLQLVMLYREIPGQPVSVIGYSCSMTGTVVFVRREGSRLASLDKDDIRIIRRNLDTVYGLHGYPHKIIGGVTF